MVNKIVCLIAGLAFLAVVVGYFLPDLFVMLQISVSFQSNKTLFATNAAIIATIVTISFSISLFTVQHAAGTYTPSLLKDYVRNAVTWMIFLILLFSVILNLLALASDLGERVACISISTSMLSFFLLPLHFYHTSNRVSPINLISRIKSRVTKQVNSLPEKVDSTIKKLKPRNDFEEKIMSNELYKWFRFHYDKSLHEPVEKGISQIFDTVKRAALKRESETAVSGLNAISATAIAYLKTRLDDPISEDDVIQLIFQHLVSVSNIAMDNLDTSLLKHILHTFRDIGTYSTKLRVISLMPGSHNLTVLSGQYVQEISEKAARNQLWDTTAEAIKSLKEVGVTSINNNKDDALTIGRISEINAVKNWFVSRIAFESLGELLVVSIRNMMDDIVLGIHFEEVTKATNVTLTLFPSKFSHYALLPLVAPSSRSFFQTTFVAQTFYALQIKKEKFPKIETARREAYIKEVVSNIVEGMRNIGENASHAGNIWIASEVVDSLYEIGLFCVREKFATLKDCLTEEINNLAICLKRLYMLWSSDPAMLPLRTHIVDSLTILAFGCLENDYEEVASTVLSSLVEMSRTMIEMGNWHKAVEIANGIQLIGVLAAEMNQDIIAKDCVNKLNKFDRIMSKEGDKTIARPTVEMLKETYKTWDEEYHRLRPRDSFKELFNRITTESLNKFQALEEKVKASKKPKES